MIFRNYTPFPHLIFESRDEQRRDFGVLVLRGTFEIAHGMPLKPVPQQEPMVMADQYHGEPGKSSLRMENNLAPFKPRSDIHFDANAYAPGGRPTHFWATSVEIGKISKQLMVTGPRYWKHTFTGWRLQDPLPVQSVPLRYEQAFGGNVENDDETSVFAENPVGCGFVGKNDLRHQSILQAPSVIPVDSPDPVLNRRMKVEGLGPIAPSWHPRLAHAGTFDSTWERSRWPDLPLDFKFDFYNSAHPDLIYPGFLQGIERVRLVNLTPNGDLRFSLPGYLVMMLHRFEDGQICPAPMFLDTAHFDIPQMRAFLVWRGLYPLTREMRVLEARIQQAGHPVNQPNLS